MHVFTPQSQELICVTYTCDTAIKNNTYTSQESRKHLSIAQIIHRSWETVLTVNINTTSGKDIASLTLFLVGDTVATVRPSACAKKLLCKT